MNQTPEVVQMFIWRAVYTGDFARCDCHPGVCNKLMTVYEARYLLMICCSLSSTLSSVKHILQDVNRKVQNRTCKQPFKGKHTLTLKKFLRNEVKLVLTFSKCTWQFSSRDQQPLPGRSFTSAQRSLKRPEHEVEPRYILTIFLISLGFDLFHFSSDFTQFLFHYAVLSLTVH